MRAFFIAASLVLGCAYPAPPPRWSTIGRDKPARKPDVPFETSSDEAIQAMIALAESRGRETSSSTSAAVMVGW